MAVGVIFSDIFHKGMDQLPGDAVYPVVVIAKPGIVALCLKIHGDAILIPHRFHLRVFNGRQRIRHHRQPGDSGGKPSGHFFVVKGHLNPLIAVFVMHIVNDIQRIHIHAGQPAHHVMIPLHHLVIFQIFRRDGLILRSHLHLADFIYAAVNGIEQAFGQVGPSAEKLHFLSNPHGGDAAGDGIIVPVAHPHQVIVLILDRRRLDGSPGTEPFEGSGQVYRPEHRQIWLRRRPQIGQRMQKPEGHLCHQRPAVDAHAADGLRYPGRVSRKQGVILRRPGEFYQAQLHDKVIHKLLNLLLRIHVLFQIPLRVNIEKCGGAPQGHGRAVLLLDRRQIAEVKPLDRFPRILRRP